ncbi:hypothetical protein FACS189450_14380 [Spirochaetia bacterium]|nr:hypothetical protein FACS189450_14380 [Spirochaetia bacterium]
MKRFFKGAALLALAMTVWSAGAFAQTTGANGTITPTTKIDTKEFPLWAKDLRRADIIAFGSFPFTMFAATFAMDALRFFDHDNNPLYAPWPFKTAGAINMSTEEYQQTLIIAAAASLTIALTDYIIVRVKRHRLAEKARKLPAGSPIIIERSVENRTEERAESGPLPAESEPSPAEP